MLPVVGALLLTYVLSPLADRLENRGLKRSARRRVLRGPLLVLVFRLTGDTPGAGIIVGSGVTRVRHQR